MGVVKKAKGVSDVLESDGRSALLPDAVISSILGQLNVTVIYKSMQCQKVFFDSNGNALAASYSRRHDERELHYCGKHGDANLHCTNAAAAAAALDNRRTYLDNKHYSCELVENDVAKCTEESGSDVGNRLAWIKLRLSTCRC
ncbi:hypothetical protein KIN20_036928 [Parelaphostrongylus tenuis]|uniref:Uncharacterized protein n=1 Tax=Parelaphostrongylus tenuis TaxID=148309 RepID=A0AAD5RD82_PARTN|nr:hypothetical protein KIN20_036928 [Parelaphostrongylus tenuis]